MRSNSGNWAPQNSNKHHGSVVCFVSSSVWNSCLPQISFFFLVINWIKWNFWWKIIWMAMQWLLVSSFVQWVSYIHHSEWVVVFTWLNGNLFVLSSAKSSTICSSLNFSGRSFLRAYYNYKFHCNQCTQPLCPSVTSPLLLSTVLAEQSFSVTTVTEMIKNSKPHTPHWR